MLAKFKKYSLTFGVTPIEKLSRLSQHLGGEALQRSTLRRKINREEHGEVPEQFMRWVWADGHKLKGLVRRREAESIHYST